VDAAGMVCVSIRADGFAHPVTVSTATAVSAREGFAAFRIPMSMHLHTSGYTITAHHPSARRFHDAPARGG